jgi:hypothetical protein
MMLTVEVGLVSTVYSTILSIVLYLMMLTVEVGLVSTVYSTILSIVLYLMMLTVEVGLAFAATRLKLMVGAESKESVIALTHGLHSTGVQRTCNGNATEIQRTCNCEVDERKQC